MTPGADKSREAAEECSPRPKAWVQSVREPSPSGAKEKFSGTAIIELIWTGQPTAIPTYVRKGHG